MGATCSGEDLLSIISDYPTVADLVSMGRGRGKGKKLTASTSYEDSSKCGEEVLPCWGGRPQKPLKREDGAEEIEGEDDPKLSAPNQEAKGPATVNVKKRKRDSKSKENSVKTENGAGSESTEQSTSSNGLRHSRSRRKSKPRRAAEAGVECK